MKSTRLTASLLFFLCLFIQDLMPSPPFFPENQTFSLQSCIQTDQTSSLQPSAVQLLQTALAGKILRLHVIADDDSDAAQKIKYLVRDAVSKTLSSLPDDISDKEDAIQYLQTRLPEIKQIADGVLSEQEASYTSKVTIDQRYYPIKSYGNFLFPEGTYDALCITLGKGEGQNWWCLAFPNLCFIEDTCVTAEGEGSAELKILLTDEEYDAILKQKPKITYRFRLFEWLKELIK